MRAVAALLFAFAVLPAAADYTASAEYRHSALDAEEEPSDYVRSALRVWAGPYSSAGVCVSRKNGAIYSFTANALYDDSSSDVSAIIGHYYAQAGSGLLYGRLKPWNPDPFDAGAESPGPAGFSPCDSSYPAYAFCGLALSYSPSSLWQACAALSVSPRYIQEEPDFPGATESSLRSVLSHCARDKTSDEIAYNRTVAASVSLRTGNYSAVQISAMTTDLAGTEGEAIGWSLRKTDGGYSAVTRVSGASIYGSYSDGAVKAFAESSLCCDRNTGSDENSSCVRAFQGELSFTSKKFRASVRGKDIGGGYGSPFYSTFGSRTPAKGIFLSMKVSPVKGLSCLCEGSAGRRTEVSLEPYSTVKESASLTYHPVRYFTWEISHRQTGRSMRDFPERRQGSAKAALNAKKISITAGFLRQTSPTTKGYRYSAGMKFTITQRHRLKADADYIFAKKEDPLNASSAAMDGVSVYSAPRRAQVYAADYLFCANSFSLRTSASVKCEGRNLTEKRWELKGKARGRKGVDGSPPPAGAVFIL